MVSKAALDFCESAMRQVSFDEGLQAYITVGQQHTQSQAFVVMYSKADIDTADSSLLVLLCSAAVRR